MENLSGLNPDAKERETGESGEKPDFQPFPMCHRILSFPANHHKSLVFTVQRKQKSRCAIGHICQQKVVMVEVAGVEPASCDGITPASTCLFCLFCLSSRNLAGRQAALRLVHLISRPESMKKAYGPGRCRRHLPLAPVREVTSPHQAASAYSSFAVIGLIEFLRGQRSSSTCR